MSAPSSEYPRVNHKGVTVWACCESIIGPRCQHRCLAEPDCNCAGCVSRRLEMFRGLGWGQ